MGDGYKDGRKRKPCTFFAQGRRVYFAVQLLSEDQRLLINYISPIGADTAINVISVTKLIEVPRTSLTEVYCPSPSLDS